MNISDDMELKLAVELARLTAKMENTITKAEETPHDQQSVRDNRFREAHFMKQQVIGFKRALELMGLDDAISMRSDILRRELARY